MNYKTAGLGLIVAAVVGAGVMDAFRHRQLRNAELAARNAEARADSTRRWSDGRVAVSAHLAEQRAVELSALERKNKAQGATIVQLRVEAESLKRTTAGLTEFDTAGHVLTAEGHLDADSLGMHVGALVSIDGVMPIGPVSSRFEWTVTREPITLGVALVCLPDHRAEARVTSAAGVPITIVGAVSRPDVCFPPPRWNALSLTPPSLPWLGAAALLGYVLAR